MAATPVYALRYATTSDQPHGPDQIKHLAEDVEAKFVLVDAAAAAITALIPTHDIQNTSGTTTSTTYTATLTGGTACGLAFVAPPSGRVFIHNTVYFFNAGVDFCFCTIRLKTGAVIGSGTDTIAASDAECVATHEVQRQTATRLVTSLTPGNSYNVQQLFRVTGNTGTFLNKNLTVQPSL